MKNLIRKYLAALALAGSLFFTSYADTPSNLDKRISDNSKKNNKPDKYAVMISGDSRSKCKDDMSTTYKTLLEDGFKKEDIYVLGTDINYYPVDDLPSKNNVRNVFRYLKKKIDDKDMLFVYTRGHGERENKMSYLVLFGPDLNQREFSQYIKGINPRIGIYLFDQCYSGGFANRIGKGRNVAIASTQPEDESSSDINDSFSHYFMRAFRDKANSDLNNDGKISLSEAFEYAKKNHSFSRNGKHKPFIRSILNSDKVFLD